MILESVSPFGSKSSDFIRFHKVFVITFSDAPKRCFPIGFLMFRTVAKRIQLLLKTLMLFDTFWSISTKDDLARIKNDKVYKVF